MKKRLLITAVLLFSAVCGHAQRENPDTVRYGDERYLFHPMYEDSLEYRWNARVPDPFWVGNPLKCTHVQHLCPQDTQSITLYGIAVVSQSHGPVFRREESDSLANQFVLEPQDVDSSLLYTYAHLIQQEGDSIFRRVDSVRWHPRPPDRYYQFSYRDRFGSSDVHDTILPMYEFYFSRPQAVHGTYYVGMRSDTVADRNVHHWISYQWAWPLLRLVSSEAVPTLWYRFYNRFDLTVFSGVDWYGWTGLFPIVAPPDTDAIAPIPVEGLRKDGLWNGRSVFVWDRTPGQLQYQVAYGLASQPPDSHSLFFAYQTSCSLPVADSLLDPTAQYAVRCRAQSRHACALHEDTLMWSEWSDPVEFYPSRPDTALAAACPQKMGFSLSPNPARDRVAVHLPDGQARPGTLVIRDVSGRERLRCKVSEAIHSLPIHDLPTGTYFVTVATNQGCTTQKLIVK